MNVVKARGPDLPSYFSRVGHFPQNGSAHGCRWDGPDRDEAEILPRKPCLDLVACLRRRHAGLQHPRKIVIRKARGEYMEPLHSIRRRVQHSAVVQSEIIYKMTFHVVSLVDHGPGT